MESGPLPPHERAWRHPSELGPTRGDVDLAEEPGKTHFAALAGGTAAVIAVALLVVSMTPRASSGPIALSATTNPLIVVVSVAAEIPATSTPLRSQSANVQSVTVQSNDPLLASFSAFPHSVTSGPQFDLDRTDIADSEPTQYATVYVRTEAVTYQMPWSSAEAMLAPDGSVVFDSNGDLVAHMTNGELVSLVDD